MIVPKIFFLVLSAASRMFLESRAFGVPSNIGMTVTGWPGDSCTHRSNRQCSVVGSNMRHSAVQLQNNV